LFAHAATIPDARDLGRFVRADDARERVAVDNRKARDAG
jgi:hypothetical protein